MNNTTITIAKAANRLGLSYSGMGELHQLIGDMLLDHYAELTSEEIAAIESVIDEEDSDIQRVAEWEDANAITAELRFHLWQIGVEAGLLHPAQVGSIFSYEGALDFCRETPNGWDVLARDIIERIRQQSLNVAETEVAQAKTSL